MKFVQFFILTFLIAREKNVAGGEFSQEDLNFIAVRLYPSECSKLMNNLPKIGDKTKKSTTVKPTLNDDWPVEKSANQCLESLIECNERGKKIGCTKKWLKDSLRKLGRADLVSRLTKRWKSSKTKKSVKKKQKMIVKKSSKSKSNGRSDEFTGKNNKSDERRKKIVKSRRRQLPKSPEMKELKIEKGMNFFDDRFIILVASASLFIVGFLGFVLLISYRRACKCFKNYAQWNFEARTSLSQNGEFMRDDTRRISQQSKEYTKLNLESDKIATDDENLSEENENSEIPRNNKIDSIFSTEENFEGCNCRRKETRQKKIISPCAKIKRFIDSQKQFFRADKEIDDEGRNENSERKRREDKIEKKSPRERDKNERKKTGKNDRRKAKKMAVGKKRVNRERREKSIRENRKIFDKTRPIGCTCEMCKLFNAKGEENCSGRTRMMRNGKT